MIIYLKSDHSIEGEICYNPSENRFRFSIPLTDKSPVIVDIIPNEKRVETFSKIEISTEMWNVIHNNLDLKDLPDNLQDEISEIHLSISNYVKKVLRYIKYCLKCMYLDENLISNTKIYWSRYKSNWKTFPSQLHVVLDNRGFWPLNKETATDIQKYIQNDFKPFFALRHLHRAINENNPRYKWIDATIAAELAIKEFLIRREPCIKDLLLEVPAPRLEILYGRILKKYNKKFLFSWEKVPGNDSERLKKFLIRKFNIEWINAAKINKNVNKKTIRITNDKNFLSLTLNNEKNNVNLKIDNQRTDEFFVKTENGNLNIYYGENSPYKNILRDGAKKRNDLIHKPLDSNVSHEEANKYIHDVENAIYHLLYLLYEKDYNSYKYFPRYHEPEK
jgi:hypothetical protein